MSSVCALSGKLDFGDVEAGRAKHGKSLQAVTIRQIKPAPALSIAGLHA
jgi:hypothetical protein